MNYEYEYEYLLYIQVPFHKTVEMYCKKVRGSNKLLLLLL